MVYTANLIIDLIILLFASLGLSISILILSLIFHFRHESPINSFTILICNNYLAIICSCIILIFNYAYTLHGHIYTDVVNENQWCYWRAYLISVALAGMYHSYLIQACFRLFRVVFHHHRKLQTMRFASILILLQWIVDFIVFVPTFYVHTFDYYKYDNNCQVLYTKIRALMYTATIINFFPVSTISVLYICMVYYIKKRETLFNQRNRQLANDRDLIVIRRIAILIGILMMVALPALLIFLWYVFTGYLYSMIYQFQWLGISFGLLILPIITTFITPQLHELLKRQFQPNNRIRPAIALQHS